MSSSSSKHPNLHRSSTTTLQTDNWPLLPDDILTDIFTRLHTLHDFFAVRAVCRNWRSASSPSPDSNSQSPLIVVSDSSSNSEALFDICSRRLYSLRLPWSRSPRFAIAYSHGYLITVVKKSTIYNSIIMWDPFTHHQIHLPENPQGFDRIILSARPDSARCLVVLFRRNPEYVQYLHVGDTHWTVVHSPQMYPFVDMMFFRGELLALDGSMMVFSVELTEDSLRVRILGGGGIASHCIYKFWLAELDGVMLSIQRYKLGEGNCCFDVFVWDSEKKRWEGTRNLGDKALFICDSGNITPISATRFGLRSNCVYYAGSHWIGWIEFPLKGRLSEEVKTCDSDVPEWSIKPIWVFPTYC